MKKLLLSLLMSAMCLVAWSAEEVIYSETFGVPTGNTNVTAYDGWSNEDVTYSGSAKVGITASNICGLTGSSKQGYMYMSSASINEFIISGINTSGYSNIKLSLNYKGSSTSAKFNISYSTDGASYTNIITQSCVNGWKSLSNVEIQSAENLSLKITLSTTNYSVFFDDIKIVGEQEDGGDSGESGDGENPDESGEDGEYTSDILTSADFVATATAYRDFSNVSKNTAKYAGNNAQANDQSIQLRSKESTSGIVSTVSGGKIKKVSVVWSSSCTAGRVLDVYGKNTAYTQATDLYNSSSSVKGTKLGSITQGTSTELVISGDYEFVGVRSNDGALNIDKITFYWEESPSDIALSFEAGELKTYSSAYPFSVTNAEVYKAAVGANEITLTKIEPAEVPAGEGVILYSAEGTEEATISQIASASAISGNALKATTTATETCVAKPSGDVYVLGGDNLFHPYTGTDFAPNRAYIIRPAAQGAAPMRVVFATEVATDIEAVETEKAVKFFENGTIFVKKNGRVYNMAGQIVK